MKLAEKVNRFSEEHRLLPEAGKVLVGLSGGVDSVVLLHLLLRAGHEVTAAHVNYGLRGAESDADEDFVRAFCEAMAIPLHVAALSPSGAAGREKSIQAVARRLRYDYFARTADELGIQTVAVAHHLDDQIETVLLNLLRGAGPVGLAGMRAVRRLSAGSPVRLVRPLLCARRKEIEAYAREHGLTWRTDASNASPKYRRSFLRTQLLPAVAAHLGDAALLNVARSAELMRSLVDEKLAPSLAQDWASAAAPDGPPAGALWVDALARLPAFRRGRVLLEALKRWLPGAPLSRSSVAALDALLSAQAGRRVRFKAGEVWRERDLLRFVPAETGGSDKGETYTLALGDGLAWPGGRLESQVIPAVPDNLNAGTPTIVYLDADRLAAPLSIRPWRPGDRFRPFGMAGHKRVSDILADSRVPSSERRSAHVLCSGDEIVWLIGLRLSDDVKVAPETKRVAKITFVPAQQTEAGLNGEANRPSDP